MSAEHWMTGSQYFKKQKSDAANTSGDANIMALDWDKESQESNPDDYEGCQKKITYVYKNGT